MRFKQKNTLTASISAQDKDLLLDQQDAFVGNYLAIARVKRELSHLDAERATGIARARIVALENNLAPVSIKPKEILAFAAAYKISAETIQNIACGIYEPNIH